MKKKQKKAPSTYTRKKIVDEFTELPISRQQKWQLRRAKEGRCVICGEPKATAWHCLKHAIANREWARKYSGSVRRNETLTYKLATKTKKKEEIGQGLMISDQRSSAGHWASRSYRP